MFTHFLLQQFDCKICRNNHRVSDALVYEIREDGVRRLRLFAQKIPNGDVCAAKVGCKFGTLCAFTNPRTSYSKSQLCYLSRCNVCNTEDE